MDPSISADGEQYVHQFSALLRNVCSDMIVPYRDGVGAVRRAFDDINQAVLKGGWHQLPAQGTGGGEDVALLTQIIEASTALPTTPPYPLVEMVVARRALSRAGAVELAEAEPLVVADAQAGLRLPQVAPPVFAFGAWADSLIYLLELGDGDFAVCRALPDDLETGPLVQPSLTRPVYRLKEGANGERLARLSSADAEVVACEAVLFEAAEMLGCATGLLQSTIAHLSTREQFGRPLGTFQALSHRVVDVYSRLETLRSLVYYASWVADSRPAELRSFALMAKGYAADCAWEAANEAIQMHGAMGFTWEQGLQHPTSRIMARALGGPSGRLCLADVGEAAFRHGQMLSLVE